MYSYYYKPLNVDNIIPNVAPFTAVGVD